MRKSILVTLAAVTLAVLVLPEWSHAGGGPKDHKAFFLRLTAGGGYGSSGDDELDVSGVSGDFTVAVGGCVSENLALHGTFWGWSLSNPDVEIDGVGSGELDGSYGMSGYGGGATYYFMPVNMYISGSAGLGYVSIDTDIFDDTSDAGFAMDLSLGKEWWVGNSWGLGLAGAFGYHSIDGASGYEVALRFSATFN
jgi:hypothetical protein